MNPITIPNISIPTIGIPTIGIPSVGFPSASGGGLAWPAGLKESIKAIYDPAKQGMTNYDVIESYTEDFTTWRYLDSRGIATITGSTIHITEAKSIQGIVEDNKEPYSDIKILVQGVTADNPLNVRDINGTKAVIDKDGVYEFKDNGLYFGFGFSKVGVVDVTITQLPTSILKDLSGNGNHAYLYGGKGKLNSGMGVYKVDFTSWTHKTFLNEIRPEKFITNDGSQYAQVYIPDNVDIPSFKVKYKLIKGDRRFLYYYVNEKGETTKVELNKDGEYTLPANYGTKEHTSLLGFISERNGICSIEQIPDYPDQLCYDGKMYAVCYGFPILTDYTVMAERTWFERQNRACFLSKITTSGTGAFGFEFYNEYNEDTTYSFGRANNVEYFKDGITYQITNSYNGIVKLDYIVNGKDNAELYIGKLRPSERPAFIGCHGTIIVADRSFTEEEINWLKDNWEKI